MNKIGIIGEGKMGTNLFHYISEFPFEMRWVASSDADTGKIAATWSKKVARGLKTGIIDPARAERMSRALITNDLHTLSDCDLVIEAVPEREDIKTRLFRQIDEVAQPDCIFASNSSSIPPSKLSPSESRRPLVIGMHFFYPVSLKNIVELVVHEHSGPGTVKRAIGFLNTIQRRFLYQREEDAFLLNRIYLEIQVEAWRIVHEGLMSPGQTDKLVKERLFPLGPFECMDMVGLDVMLPAIRNYTRHSSDPGRYRGLIEELEKLVGEGRLGRKSGQGYFDHSEDGMSNTFGDSPLPEPVTGPAVTRLKAALDHAVETLGAGSSGTREEILIGLKEYFGD